MALSGPQSITLPFLFIINPFRFFYTSSNSQSFTDSGTLLMAFSLFEAFFSYSENDYGMVMEKIDFRFKMLCENHIILFYLKYYECMYLHLLILIPHVCGFDSDRCLLLTPGYSYMGDETHPFGSLLGKHLVRFLLLSGDKFRFLAMFTGYPHLAEA